MGAIEVPVLVLIGDTDFILVPDAVSTVELLPYGQVAVLPGTTHMDLTRSELVVPVVGGVPGALTLTVGRPVRWQQGKGRP